MDKEGKPPVTMINIDNELAETLSRAKNTSVDGLSEAGIVEARAGKVRLYRRDELDLTPGPSPKGRGEKWDPTQDKRLTA